MSAAWPLPEPLVSLDLRGVPCPLNFIRSRLALEKIPPGSWLQLDLDGGEPELSVTQGLREEGHRVVEVPPAEEGSSRVRLMVCRGG